MPQRLDSSDQQPPQHNTGYTASAEQSFDESLRNLTTFLRKCRDLVQKNEQYARVRWDSTLARDIIRLANETDYMLEMVLPFVRTNAAELQRCGIDTAGLLRTLPLLRRTVPKIMRCRVEDIDPFYQQVRKVYVRPDDLIPLAEACQRFDVSRPTLQRHIKAGKLRSYRADKASSNSPHRVSEADLAAIFPSR